VRASSKVVGYSQVWWFTPVILALGRLKQEDHEFEASLGYIERSCQRERERGRERDRERERERILKRSCKFCH
jgi:hypothetical protein